MKKTTKPKSRDIFEQELSDHIFDTVKKYIPSLPDGTQLVSYSGECMNTQTRFGDYPEYGRHSFRYLPAHGGWCEVFKVELLLPDSQIILQTKSIFVPVVDMKMPLPKWFPNAEIKYQKNYGNNVLGKETKGTVKYVLADCYGHTGKTWRIQYQMSSNGHDTITDEDVM